MIERVGCGITIGVVCALVVVTLIVLFAAALNLTIENAEHLWLLLIGGAFVGAVWAILPISDD